MEENKVRLVFRGTMEIAGSENVGLILLANEEGTKQLNVLCDKHMLYEFAVRKHPDRQNRHLIAESVWSLFSQLTDERCHILIHGIAHEQYQCIIVAEPSLLSTPIRMSDAVLLATITEMPILMDAALFERQSLPATDQEESVSLPINTVSAHLLQKALDKAIEDEDYEMASRLRDEISRRSKRDQGQNEKSSEEEG